MENECSVVHCGNASSETKVFYNFPMAFNMCMQWVQNTGNQKLLQDFSLGGTHLFSEKYICSDHFSEKDFEVFGQPQSGLRCDAVPLVPVVRKESKVRNHNNMPKPSIKLKDKTYKKFTKSAVSDDISAATSIKKESVKIGTTAPEEINKGSPDEIAKREPFERDKEKHGKIGNKLPFPQVNPDEENDIRPRCRAFPLIPGVKKESKGRKRMPKPSINLKDKTRKKSTKSAVSNDIPAATSIKEEPDAIGTTKPEEMYEGFLDKIAKEEPFEIDEKEPDEIDNILPFPQIKPKEENDMSASYDAVFIPCPIIEPEIIENPYPLPCAAFGLEGEYPDSDSLTNPPKIEEVDIEEVLLPTYTDPDVHVKEETADDESGYSPQHSEDDPSLLFNISGIEYLGNTSEKSLEQRRKDALRQARAREQETPEQRDIRLEKTRIRAQERRQSESDVETSIRRYKSAVRAAVKRSTESEEEKRNRQEKNKIRAAERRRNMTPEERAEWREKNRMQTRERRQKESEIKKIVRRYNNAIRASIKRSSETPEKRMERRLKDALRAAERRKNETPEERQKRLQKDRERITLRRLQMIMTETPEQREARLKKERERMYRKRHGLSGDVSTDASNDGMEGSQHDSDEDLSLSDILCMYPPKVEIQAPDDAQSVDC